MATRNNRTTRKPSATVQAKVQESRENVEAAENAKVKIKLASVDFDGAFPTRTGRGPGEYGKAINPLIKELENDKALDVSTAKAVYGFDTEKVANHVKASINSAANRAGYGAQCRTIEDPNGGYGVAFRVKRAKRAKKQNGSK